VKVTVTVVAAAMLTVQVGPVPEQPPPDHAVTVDPVDGVAVRVTEAPAGNGTEQVAPQLTCEPWVGVLAEVTAPAPFPARTTVSAWSGTKVAVAVRAALIVTEQVSEVPLQALDHDQNAEPADGAAVSVTTVPSAKLALHVAPQAICVACVGLLVDVTVPAPVPVFVTVRARRRRNSALTLRTCDIVTEHVPEALAHAPVHPVKTEPDAAVAVSVTAVG
jgi:hypothetical protein